MTYPQQPYGQLPPGYPAPQQGYAPPPPAPQYPQPGYPQQPQYYSPAPPATGFAPPQPAEQVRGTLQDFMNQPATGGGPSLTFPHPGTSYTGAVARNVTDADVQAQTDMITGAVQTYNDRRPKLVMRVPLVVQPTAQFPEGTAVWYVKGNDRAELARAMEAAGAEPGAPRAGDVITITYTHDQPGRKGMNPTKVKRVEYRAGNGEPPAVPQAQQPQYGYPAQAPPALPGYGQQPGYAVQQPQAQYPPQQVQVPAGQPFAMQPGAEYVTPPGYTAATAQQPPAVQYVQQPDPAQAYQQATGQPMPPQYAQQPQVITAQGAAQLQPYSAGGQAQVVPPTQGAPAAPPASTPGAQPTAPASPSNPVMAPGQPPADWPPDVPFIPGLTPAQARMAATMNLGGAQG